MKKQTTKDNHLRILASGKGWLAVDKPAGVSVHNDPGRDLCALVANRLQTDTDLKIATGLNGIDHLSAAHRLDRETSGVILLAGSQAVLNHFATQFETRTVKKYYTAILHGLLPLSTVPDRWETWRWTLTKTAGGRQNPRGKGPRKACTTFVRVLGCSDHYSLVECRLLTGRKHQIRRHAKLAGHPVVGDRRYGSKRALEFLATKRKFKRLGLHASRLKVQPPGGQPMTFHTHPLPIEMQQLFDGDGPPAALPDLALS
ncbi:MAG: RluA family pseudouridine synthase [Desulfobacterales bacterium]|nr:RluA family pseudouridine synthase [Desulfobacterales bacterium]